MKNTVRKNIWENQNSSRVFCWIRLESPLDNKIKPVNPTGNQPWIFIGKTDAEAEAPIFWPSDAKRWLIGKDPDAGKDRRQEEKGPTDDERVGWHHRFNGHEFEQTPGDGEGTGKPGVLQFVGLQSQTSLSNRATGTNFMKVKLQKLVRRRHVSRYLNKMSAVKFKGRLSYTEGPSISLYIL